jgi:carnosine N-methyltransferase
VTQEEIEAMEEQEHFSNVLQSFSYYFIYSSKTYTRMHTDWTTIPDAHKKLTADQPERLKTLRALAKENAKFLDKVIENDRIFENENYDYSGKSQPQFSAVATSEFNMDKVISTVKQFVREWSKEGEEERNKCFLPIMEELAKYLPITDETRYKYRVVCPGSGLGRLPFEICKRGYACQGNEFSYFMLIPSNYMLNRTTKTDEFTIYPFIHQISNIKVFADQIRPVTIPDVLPSDLPKGADFSYSAGEFVQIYKPQKESWDAVCTCFFMDTANNIVEYIETIHEILKPGGVWINLGPLLYHYSDIRGEVSIELTNEQFMRVVREVGFEIKQESTIDTRYTSNTRSMLESLYHCNFFTAIKK